MNWSTAHSGLPCPSGGTPWVSDRIQTAVCRRRRVSGLPPPRRHRTRKHSNDKRTLVTHTLDDGRSSQAGAPAFAIALKTRVDSTLRRGPQSTFYAAGGCGYSSGFPRVRRLRRRVRRRGFLLRAGSRSRPPSSPTARPRIWRRSGPCREPCWISHWSAAIGGSDMPYREFHPRARFRQTPPGACRSTEIPRFPPDSPSALTVPFMKGCRPHQTQRLLRAS